MRHGSVCDEHRSGRTGGGGSGDSGDAADVAETFFASGGEMLQMYTSNYYAIFGPRPDNTQYAEDLKDIIVPAVVEWKESWKEEHGTPEDPKDELGRIDIDKSLVYLPINEGSPQVDEETGVSNNHTTFYESWEMYYKAIKEADPNATVGGPNDAAYGHWRPGGMKGFLEYCAEQQVVINEYATMEACGVPGILIRYIAMPAFIIL